MPQESQELLGIYLNDHLAGATAGVELARRVARRERDWAGAELSTLAAEIGADRKSLLRNMSALAVPVNPAKTAGGWLAEKASRCKLNGTLLWRSPLSGLLELEMIMLGVTGKAAGWRTLRVRADTDRRLNARLLDELIARADRQGRSLEGLRERAAARL